MENRKKTPRYRAKALLTYCLITGFQPHLAAGAEPKYERLTGAENLQISFTQTRPYYDKNQNISFHFRGNQDVYLYGYTTNANGSHTLILPNALQNINRYIANRDHLIPNQRVRFQADGSANIEAVYLLASTDRLDMHTTVQPAAGVFYNVTGIELHRAFASKGISIRDTEDIHLTPQANLAPTLNTTPKIPVRFALQQLEIQITDAVID